MSVRGTSLFVVFYFEDLQYVWRLVLFPYREAGSGLSGAREKRCVRLSLPEACCIDLLWLPHKIEAFFEDLMK